MRGYLKFISTCSIGLFVSILAFVSCDKDNLPPVAKLLAFPSAGDTSVLFDFSAEGTSDDKNYPIGLVFRWDFDGDGTWDTEYSKTNSIAHKYKLSGNYNVRVEVKDIDGLIADATDSIEVYRVNTDIDTLVDPRDGNRYQIVKIDGRWWMAENLKYGIEIPTDREQTDNDTVEFYRNHTSKGFDTVGGVYLWYESMNYRREDPKGICPDGWHIPTKAEWEALFSPRPVEYSGMYYDLYSLQYYRKDGPSNPYLDLANSTHRDEEGTFFWYNFKWGGFWSSDSRWISDPPYFVYYPYECYFSSFHLHVNVGCWVNLQSLSYTPLMCYLSVRCIKNN